VEVKRMQEGKQGRREGKEGRGKTEQQSLASRRAGIGWESW
jgi:hypothetical protein